MVNEKGLCPTMKKLGAVGTSSQRRSVFMCAFESARVQVANTLSQPAPFRRKCSRNPCCYLVLSNSDCMTSASNLPLRHFSSFQPPFFPCVLDTPVTCPWKVTGVAIQVRHNNLQMPTHVSLCKYAASGSLCRKCDRLRRNGLYWCLRENRGCFLC